MSVHVQNTASFNQCYLFNIFPAIANYELPVFEVGRFLPQNAPTTSPLVVNFVIFGMHVLHTATWSEAWVVDMHIRGFQSGN